MTTKNKILHFDTIDSIGNYDEVFSGRLNGSGQTVTGDHTFNSKMTVASQIENVKSISLKTVEFPFMAFNVRSSNKSNYMAYEAIYNGSTVNAGFYLRDKNYTNISSLLSDIKSAFATSIALYSQLTGFTVDFYLNPLDSTKITVKSNPTQVMGGLLFGQLLIRKSVLSNIIMGQSFQKTANSDFFLGNADTYSYMNCTNNYNLQPDNYFNMNITNIQTSPANANGRPTTFKIPLTGSFGEIIYWSENDGTQQTVTVDRPNTTLDYVNMVITDRWGFHVYSNGAQVSFTLNVEYEDYYN